MPGPGYYWIGEEEETEVLEVIRSKRLNRYGSADDPEFNAKVFTLEGEVARKFSMPHSLAVTSGTAALVVALNALRIGPGDEVIVPGYTYIASISAIIFSGAVPVLSEVDESLNLDPSDVEAKITPRTKALMVVHMLGNPARVTELMDIARRHNLRVIEDTAQAFAGRYGGQYLGTFGDIGTYSFNIFKTINAGDGGLLVMKDEDVFKTAFAYHDQGHMPLRMGLEIGNRSVIGMNFRMNELTAAVLLAQLRKVDDLLTDLHRIKRRLKSQLQEIPELDFREIVDEDGECATLLVMLLPSAEIAKKVAADLGSKTISESGWHVYNNMEQIIQKRQLTPGPPFQSSEFPTQVEYRPGMLPRTDEILSRAVNLSIGVVDAGLGSGFGLHPKATVAEIDRVGDQVVAAVRKYL
jgi:dTDP-4-amino-4,6-dideoxygalactose transaminase